MAEPRQAVNPPIPPEGYPASFGPDVTVRDIDLDEEEFYLGGKRLTEERAAELASRAKRRPR